MSDDGPWLSVPQAVVLVATRDIELALGLTENNAALLVIKANQRIAVRTVIPLEANADDEQRRDALTRLREERAALRDDSLYLEAQEQLHRRLLAGVRTKASKTPGEAQAPGYQGVTHAPTDRLSTAPPRPRQGGNRGGLGPPGPLARECQAG